MPASPWTAELDQECTRLVTAIVREPPPARDVAWRQLLERIGPRIEAWARRNASLQRCGLTGVDEARTVLVQVLTRLKAHDHASLRCYLERTVEPGATDEAAEARVVEEAARLAPLTGPEQAVPPRLHDADADPDRDQATGTPFRGWLLAIVRYAVKDHIKQRLGWIGAAAPGDKRDVNTNADRFTTDVGGSARPPVTDVLTVGRFVAEAQEVIAGFPPPMRRALELWLDGEGFDDIGRALALGTAARPPAEEARALVRAAQARLRQRFRDDWGAVFGRAEVAS